MDEASKLPSETAPPTGSPEIDAEHAIQLGLLRAAQAQLNRGDDPGQGSDEAADATELVEQLFTYSHAHFLSEQLLMRLAARSNYEGHVQRHEELMQDLDAVRAHMQSGDHAAAATVLRAHERRLLEHIRSWDQAV
ncbi:MAG: hypothetical protein EHM68_00455 [Lysobacterales bacterium]|nr:MAG: hypothetical protein EHM68_00455 [Xanthomonadales bacterium]